MSTIEDELENPNKVLLIIAKELIHLKLKCFSTKEENRSLISIIKQCTSPNIKRYVQPISP